MRIQMMIGIAVTLSLLLGWTTACSRSQNDGAKIALASVNDPAPGEVPAPKSVIFPPAERHVLPMSQGAKMLHPCSREAPQSNRFWEPSESEIDNLEKELVTFMHARELAGSQTQLPGLYGRQYLGFFRNGKRYIYGNYYPDTAESYHSLGPVDVCDGGPAMWGLVFDVKANSFTELALSGSI